MIIQILLENHFFGLHLGYTYITSPFGYRISPTAGASNFHKGVDIGASEGSKVHAISDGEITYVGFLGGGGYTITLSFLNYKVSYCHMSPLFLVRVGDKVSKGQVIGYIGPKNVYGVPENIYEDEYRQSN